MVTIFFILSEITTHFRTYPDEYGAIIATSRVAGSRFEQSRGAAMAMNRGRNFCTPLWRLGRLNAPGLTGARVRRRCRRRNCCSADHPIQRSRGAQLERARAASRSVRARSYVGVKLVVLALDVGGIGAFQGRVEFGSGGFREGIELVSESHFQGGPPELAADRWRRL